MRSRRSGNSSAQPLRRSAASLQTLRRSAPASNIFPMALRPGALASNLAHLGRICFPMVLRPGTLASNKPHLAEKSTPVWLAIWRI